MYVCCDERMTAANRRHLWDQHDPERWRFDPDGEWLHKLSCDRCRNDD